LKAQTAPKGRLYLTEAVGTVHAGSAETKVNDMHATGDAMGVVAQAFPLLCPL